MIFNHKKGRRLRAAKSVLSRAPARVKPARTQSYQFERDIHTDRRAITPRLPARVLTALILRL
jgi:hypothetical protein